MGHQVYTVDEVVSFPRKLSYILDGARWRVCVTRAKWAGWRGWRGVLQCEDVLGGEERGEKHWTAPAGGPPYFLGRLKKAGKM